jgi:hypothetical protein
MNGIARTIAAGIFAVSGFTAFTACGDAQAPAQDIGVHVPAAQQHPQQDDHRTTKTPPDFMP